MSEQSKTPRTDEFYWKAKGIAPVGRSCSEWGDFARQLENELSDADIEIRMLKNCNAQVNYYSNGGRAGH